MEQGENVKPKKGERKANGRRKRTRKGNPNRTSENENDGSMKRNA